MTAAGMDMGSVQSFAPTWTVMTAAMMTPSALPFVISFARRTSRWQLPTAVLVTAYFSVWVAFGVSAYYLFMLVSLPLPAPVTTGIAVAFAGLYAFTPLMRIGQARCIAMCRRTEAIGPAGVLRGAASEGVAYGIGCVACSGGVMLALIILGMSNIVLMVAGSALILLYKIAGRWPRRIDAAVSVALALAGVWLIAL
jgi:predicted metal-binding membrane protein